MICLNPGLVHGTSLLPPPPDLSRRLVPDEVLEVLHALGLLVNLGLRPAPALRHLNRPGCSVGLDGYDMHVWAFDM
jgi:hypothetical protein